MTRFITQIGQSRVILLFIIVIGAILGYLNYSGAEPLIVSDDTDLNQRRDSLESLSDFTLDFSILEDETYKSLQIFGENPVNPGITGRRNPFAPFQ